MARQTDKQSTDAISQKMTQFHNLPDSCSACMHSFDKKDKDMVQSWSVVVKQEVVRLFCPDCLQKTKEIIDDYTQTQPERP